MKKDSELYARSAKMARSLAGTEAHQASKVIRALLSRINQQDREIAAWKSGRAHRALENENVSLRAANKYLTDMLRQQKEAS